MTSHERKLLRKQINLKLKCMATKESKENDFLTSSQMLTERQQWYMTISKHFRVKDNRSRSNKLPFDIEKTSLPHVNLSLLNRLYEATNNTMNSPTLDRVLNAHSFRTATPFYTNPELTIDRGKIMNYTSHIGAILHTPSYIDFIKNSPSYATATKSQQRPKSKHKRRYCSSESNSSLVMSIQSEISDENTFKSSNISARSENSEFSKNKDEAYERNRAPLRSVDAPYPRYCMTNLSEPTSIAKENVGYESRNSSVHEASDKRKESISSDRTSQNNLSGIPMSGGENMSEDKLKESAIVEDSGKDEEDKNETLEASIVEAVENFFINTEIKKEDIVVINRYFDTFDKYRLDRPAYVQDYGAHLSKDNINLGQFQQILSLKNMQHISEKECEHIKEIIRKYESNNDKVSRHPEDNNEAGKDGEKLNERIDENIDESKNHDTTKEEVSQSETSSSFKEEEEGEDGNSVTNDSNAIENASKNIINTIYRIFPMDVIKQNYDISIDKEDSDDNDTEFEDPEVQDLEVKDPEVGDPEVEDPEVKDPEVGDPEVEDDEVENEDFAESFKNLFRNSITQMKKDDITDLKKLIRNEKLNQKNVTESDNKDFLNKFVELFNEEKPLMNSDDKINLINLVENGGEPKNKRENLEKFEKLLKKCNYHVSENDLKKIKEMINEIEVERLSPNFVKKDNDIIDEKEDNEVMLAFRNLFRSSIAKIKEDDLEMMQSMIIEHEQYNH